MKTTYKQEATNLAKSIDIAINSLKKYPPRGFDETHINQMTKTYLDFKFKVLNPQAEFKNKSSLKFLEQSIFIFFQESSGKAVNFFWKEIKKQNLTYKRENQLKKIISRNKIKNHAEYEYISDTLFPFKEEGMIEDKEVVILKKLMVDFEKKINH